MPKRLVYLLVENTGLATQLEPILTGMGFCVTRDSKEFNTSIQLESAHIDAAPVTSLYGELETLITRISALIEVFQPGYDVRLRLHQISEQKPNGRWTSTKSLSLRVIDPKGFGQLASPTRTGTNVCARFIELAQSDPKIAEALALVSGGAPSWHSLYDVLEFFGGKRGVAKRGWASQSTVDRFMRTANHYRHLGAPKRYPLPRNPPDIEETRTFVLGLLRRWLEGYL